MLEVHFNTNTDCWHGTLSCALTFVVGSQNPQPAHGTPKLAPKLSQSATAIPAIPLVIVCNPTPYSSPLSETPCETRYVTYLLRRVSLFIQRLYDAFAIIPELSR